MHRNNQIREFWTGIMAGVFLWLAVGALINFHQQHVFGKAHILQLNAALSFKKDDRIYAGDSDSSKRVSLGSAILLSLNHTPELYPLLLWNIADDASSVIPESFCLTNPSLRAPPVS